MGLIFSQMIHVKRQQADISKPKKKFKKKNPWAILERTHRYKTAAAVAEVLLVMTAASGPLMALKHLQSSGYLYFLLIQPLRDFCKDLIPWIKSLSV